MMMMMMMMMMMIRSKRDRHHQSNKHQGGREVDIHTLQLVISTFVRNKLSQCPQKQQWRSTSNTSSVSVVWHGTRCARVIRVSADAVRPGKQAMDLDI